MTDERQLWMAVIHQALNDATYGFCDMTPDQIHAKINPKATRKTRILVTAKSEAYISRAFIEGRTGMLKKIVTMLGDDYEYMREKLMATYKRCEPHIIEYETRYG